jgi:hypothetical protein
MPRLALVNETRRDHVVWTDGNVNFLLIIPVHVTEHHIDGPVGVPLPSFENGDHVLTPFVTHLSANPRYRNENQDGFARARSPSAAQLHRIIVGWSTYPPWRPGRPLPR